MTRTIEKLMSLSRVEFEMSLVALDPAAVLDANGHASVTFASTEARIRFETLPDRRLGGLLAMPQARVRITLANATDAQAAAFLRRFDIAFQRGGG